MRCPSRGTWLTNRRDLSKSSARPRREDQPIIASTEGECHHHGRGKNRPQCLSGKIEGGFDHDCSVHERRTKNTRDNKCPERVIPANGLDSVVKKRTTGSSGELDRTEPFGFVDRHAENPAQCPKVPNPAILIVDDDPDIACPKDPSSIPDIRFRSPSLVGKR